MGDCVYIGIGNPGDKLTQEQWSQFVHEVHDACLLASRLIGAWFSEPSSPLQDGCLCIAAPKPAREKWLRQVLATIAQTYNQDCISWAQAKTEMIGSAR